MKRAFDLPATWMRGGTSKGLFLRVDDLSALVGDDAAARDRLLLRLIGSPDPYGTQMDGLGGGTSSTSKVVLVGRSRRDAHDVDYWFGAVAIDQALIDWSGNCGNLSAAVAPFALAAGLVDPPHGDVARIRMWQGDIGKTIVAQVPMIDGRAAESGNFSLDGVAFAGAPIRLEFLDPAGAGQGADRLLPTGHVTDRIELPNREGFEVSLLNAGNPTVFVRADSLGLLGTEMQADVNSDAALLSRLEALRAHAAVCMGLADTAQQATEQRPATPKLCFVAPPRGYTARDGKPIAAADIDLLARIVSMGKLHHAMTGTGVVALGVAAAIEGSVVQQVMRRDRRGSDLHFGHPSGTTGVEALVRRIEDGEWHVESVALTRTARRLMVGSLPVPGDALR